MTEGPYIKVFAASAESLLKLADQLVANSDRDEDLVLSGVVRDCALEIRRALENYPKEEAGNQSEPGQGWRRDKEYEH